ncbi:EF-hand domain-containing protein [Streptomyces sp. A3M-1-3]|uniref:EF-hand domain-containing protein n=1 Tax=Streptomyces sp. A3M-1-3 TaxID=2962044 RepID=UPI0020B70561|nr:EF-hand domain-containing protein [Streptomyces sp. A3M-1-3]MCP3819997.1 EF-hand domain-containing protein [Streptomyces sp. A3M-1-3]
MGLREYQERIASRFAAFDRDRDGAVSVHDFREMAGVILAEFGESEHTASGRALVDGAERFWQGLADAADVDRDGRLTEEEFVRAATASLLDNPEGFAYIVLPWVEASITIADTDGDGELTPAEWRRMLRAMNAHGVPAHATGPTLTIAEVMASAVAYYTSDRPMPQAIVRTSH